MIVVGLVHQWMHYYCFGKELKIKQIQSFKVSIQDFKLKKYKPGSRRCTKLRLNLRLFTTSKSFNWKKTAHFSFYKNFQHGTFANKS